ncbi:uncharacterized protein [Watersipora subatra]|uniref:uncharacterized protein n=1 Tax=Watersipora subatra TaxID=2589382 RepID=UPI00355AF0CB
MSAIEEQQTQHSTTFHSILEHPINMAHVFDRRAEHYLTLNPPNYVEAIKAHQCARAKLDEVLLAQKPEKKPLFVNEPKTPLLVSLYGQKCRHSYMQNVILSKQRKALSECKEMPYQPTAMERKEERAQLDAHRQERQRIERVYKEQMELCDRLDLEWEEQQLKIDSAAVQWSSAGKKKPKSYDETVEELKSMHSHCKSLTDQYSTAIMLIKAELTTLAEREQPVSSTDSTNPSYTATPSDRVTQGFVLTENLESSSTEKPLLLLEGLPMNCNR